jgi:hypothetical protein
MTFQAITTKYFGPGNRRGSYIKAKAFAGSLSTEYDCSISLEANHMAAAKAFAEKYKWAGYWFGGGLPDGQGNVYVCHTPGNNPNFITVGES